MADAPRLLLLELVTTDPWAWNGRQFPHVAGLVRGAGGAARWLWYGVTFEATADARGLDLAPRLDDEGRTHLDAALAAFAPTHVLLSHPPGEALAERLRRGAPGAALRVAGEVEQGNTGADPEERLARAAWVLDWLGAPRDRELPGAGYLVGAAEPWYGAEPGNDAARSVRLPLVVTGGVACDDARPLGDNPFYADTAAGGWADWTGCAFCTTSRRATCDPAADPVGVALAQILAAGRTGGAGGRRSGLFQLVDARLVHHLPRLFEGLLASGAPPGTYEIAPRLDALLAAEAGLRALLPRLAGSGHVLRVGRLGAESLSDAENARLHKGLTLALFDDAARLLRALAHDYPTAFQWDGTFAYISFTPWTTLDDLAVVMRAGLERGLGERDGWLFTPVELWRGSPLTARAGAEGDLVAPAFEDPAWLYEPSLGGVDTRPMTPWRFRDPRVDVAFRLIVRGAAAAFAPDWPPTVFEGDALYGWMLAERDRRGLARLRPAWFAQAVVRALGAATGRPDPREIAAAAFDAVAALPEALAPLAESQGAAPAAACPAPRASRVLQAALDALPSLADVRLIDARFAGAGGALRVDVTLRGAPLALRLEPAAAEGSCLFRMGPLAVSHERDTPVRHPDDVRTLRRLVEAYLRLAGRVAPELLPGAKGQGAGRDSA